MNKEDIKLEAKRISQILQSGSIEEVSRLGAPGRKKPLEVIFQGGKAMSINAHEIDGEFSLCIDGLEKEPEWVSELGSQFITRPLS